MDRGLSVRGGRGAAVTASVFVLLLLAAAWAPAGAGDGPEHDPAPAAPLDVASVSGSAGPDPLYDTCLDAVGDDLANELCTTQYDGGAHGDATGVCGESDRGIAVPVQAEPANGLLRPSDDLDRYFIEVAPGLPVLDLELRASPATDGLTQLFTFDLELRPVFAPGVCGPEVGNVSHIGLGLIRVTLEGPPPGTYDLGVHRTGWLVDDGGLPGVATRTPGAAPESEATVVGALGVADVCHGACFDTSNRLFGYEFAAV